MRLIDTEAIELVQITEPAEYSYAILSHTWEDEEVSIQDFQYRDRREKMKGFDKIKWTCRLALEHGLRYAWVDTCCIDKTSSAELSEAINSMFMWYMTSAVCIVYLSDHPPQLSFEDHFPRSRWLKRGWTLQELIAPRTAEFYDAAWNFRGRKPELNSFLAHVTNIDEAVLHNSQTLFDVPVGRRMSWAARRQTTRVEDQAYCLLGIFGVNMPMIYGEGARAFMRLQEEIVKETNDLSLFAWTDIPPGLSGTESWMQQNYRGIFARSPREFANCHHLRPRIKDAFLTKEFMVTNKGLRIETALVSVPGVTQDYVWNLGVSERDDWPKDSVEGWVGVYLAKTANGYVRSRPYSLFRAEPQWRRYRNDGNLIHIRKDLRALESEPIENRYQKAICLNFERAPCHIAAVAPPQLWDQNRMLFLNQGQGINAYMLLRFSLGDDSNSTLQLLIACSTMVKPVCYIWAEHHPLWSSAMEFLNTAREVSDYVAADYLRLQLLPRTSDPSPVEACSIRHPLSNAMINVQAVLQPHVFEGQPCYALELVLGQSLLPNTTNGRGISDMNLC
ncbi:HET-domain-containing protein [Hypomontagnella submonticulosa]|nr:HET-domain-containing protein [Hypomontagnella submonticulosa]